MTEIDYNELSELVVKYQNGDGSAFEQIYNMTYRTAKFTALKILNNNESDADDVMQDCYIKVMEKIGTLKDPSSFMSWFNMMVANRAKSLIRKNNPRFYEKDKEEDYSHLDDEWTKEFGDFNQSDYNEYSDNNIESGESIGESKKQAFIDEASSEDYESFLPESDLEKEELCKTVMDMIENLSEEKKTAVILFYYNNLTTREISESIGVSENTIKSRLLQAKKDISKAVSAYENKNGKLLAISPASLVIWALKNSAASTSVVPYVASGIAAGAGIAGAATAAGTGIATKIIAGVVIAGVVAGGGVAGTKAVKNRISTQEEQTTTAIVEEYTEQTTQAVIKNESVIPSRPIEEYTVAENKRVDTYLEKGQLKYGVNYSIQRYANKTDGGVDVYSGRPVLDRKKFHATYEELLPAAIENHEKYSVYINDSVSAINEERTASGKAALEVDDILTEQANVRAEEVAWTARDTAKRSDGTSYTELFDRNGYSTGSRDEIRRVNYSSYDSAISAILSDERINGDFEKIGVGVAQNPENEKLVFVVHLYSSEDGKSNEELSARDKWVAWKNDIIDNIQNRLLDTDDYYERVDKLEEIPFFNDILNYDLNIDPLFEKIKQRLDQKADEKEKRGE